MKLLKFGLKRTRKRKKQKNIFEVEIDINEELEVPEEVPSQKTKSKKARRRAKEAAKGQNLKQQNEEEATCTVENSTEEKQLNGSANEEDEGKVPDNTPEVNDMVEEISIDKSVDGQTTKDSNQDIKKLSNNKNKKQKATLKCQKCQQGFPSKNKLFDHLQSSGHAVPLEASAPPAGEEKGKKGKKKNKR